MPDLANLSLSSSLSLTRCPDLKLLTLDSDDAAVAFDPGTVKSIAVSYDWGGRLVQKDGDRNRDGIRVLKRAKKGPNSKVLEDYLKDWFQRKMESGVPQSRCFLPFLVGAKKLVLVSSCELFCCFVVGKCAWYI